MTEVKTAQNTLPTGKNGNTPAKKNKTIFDVIKSGEKQFSTALPQHLNGERFVRIAITTIRQNPKLAECSQESLFGSLMTIAQLGLEPGVLGQCYLIPFKNNKLGTMECQFQLGYKGMIELLRRTGQLSDIYAYPVYSNDEFDIEYGLERTLKHKPAFNNQEGRGEATGFYSVAIMKDGTRAFEYMTKQEIIDHEEKYRKGKFKNDIWNKNFEEMALKTVTKKMLKWLPISVEMIENLRKENQTLKYNEKTNEITEEENVIDLSGESVVEVEKVSKEEITELLRQANLISYDIKKDAEENGIDLDDMSKEDFVILQDIVNRETENRM